MAPIIGGSYLGLLTCIINSGVPIAVAAISKKRFSSFAGVPISAAMIGITGMITFTTKESVSKDPNTQRIYQYGVPFILTACLTPMISTQLNCPTVTWLESISYGIGGMLAIKVFS
ncbi:MAG: hypothetical protein H7A41_05605 [Chlamydiales bacterium]|nr:hypothetical protein [Chlamydiia bacterium]MCP5504610.1 hypothetical protein [Chlamydiales bacterium]